jgi:membrane-bound lytic murein transglycosylase B
MAWALLAAMLLGTSGAQANPQHFDQWLRGLRIEALQRGIAAPVFDRAMAGVQPIPRVLELDRSQPEFTMTFDQYLDRVVSPARIAQGRALYRQHRAMLDEVGRQYGVPARLIVALWGIESNFGQRQGDYSVLAALATLAYDGRRARYFRGELINALRIVNQGHIAAQAMLGSWAGAMGQCQFMPSSYLKMAVDQDGDGRRDIWTSLPDVFGSIANYMRRVGWNGGELWGREVRLPANFNARKFLGSKRSVDEWQKIGLRRSDGGDLPRAELRGELIRGGESDRYFLVYGNFRTILAWNSSRFFALAVGLLSDRVDD